MTQIITIPLTEDTNAIGDLYLPDSLKSSDQKKLIVLCHGFTAYRRYRFLPVLGARLAEAGYFVLAIDFPNTGICGLTGAVLDKDLFSLNTFTAEQLFLKKLLLHVRKSGLHINLQQVQFDKFFTLGHSRGGIAAITGVIDSNNSPLTDGVSVWAAPSDVRPERFGATEEVKSVWRSSGLIYYPVQRLGIELPLRLPVLDDMESDPDRVQRILSSIGLPLLAIHGELDQSVAVQCAKEMADWSKHGAELFILPHTDHQFNTIDKPDNNSPELEKAIARTIEFFNNL